MNYRTITIPYKQPIDAIVYSAHNSKGTVVYSHGLFSSKDAYKINQIAPALCQSGYTVISFSYCYTRDYASDTPLIIELPACAHELNAVLEYAAVHYNANLHIVGSSMGGTIAMYYCAMMPYTVSIKSVSIIATPVHLQHLVTMLAPQGIHGDSIAIGEYTIAASSLNQLNSIQLIHLIPRIDVPVCIIHGNNDTVVPVTHAYDIQKNLCVPHTMHIIPDGDHTLTSKKHVDLILQYILSWFTMHP